MANALAFGEYLAGTSPVHTLNAQVKILLTCAFSISVFLVDGWPGILVLTAGVAVLYLVAGVKISRALSGLKPLVFILAFTVLVHMFSINVGTAAQPGQSQAGSLGFTQQWVLFGSFGITLDGLVRGLFAEYDFISEQHIEEFHDDHMRPDGTIPSYFHYHILVKKR